MNLWGDTGISIGNCVIELEALVTTGSHFTIKPCCDIRKSNPFSVTPGGVCCWSQLLNIRLQVLMNPGSKLNGKPSLVVDQR